MASYNLEDGVQMWYVQVQADEGTPSWRRFTELLNLRYGPPLRSAPLAELAECQRTGTVAEYQDRFQTLLPRAGPLRESQRVQLFIGGLQPPLSINVRIQNPQSLAAAMSLARQFELREQYAAPVPRAPPRPLLPAPPPRLALPAPPGPKAATPATISIEGRQIKRLTQAEQEERRRKGLCYNCDEKYTRGHNHVCQRLILLEGVEEDDTDGPTEESEEAAAEDTPVFSLQALAGVSFADTMQVAVTLGSVALVALLDSGSTHNFIFEVAARRSGLPLQQRPCLTAMVANGERVSCVGIIRGAPLTIDGAAFPADLFVMPLAGYDVVLGTRWLGALGPIVWDLARCRMTFQRQGRTICWSGVESSSAPTLSAVAAGEPLLNELLDSFGDIFAAPTGLPPKRAHDHRITLKAGAQPVAVRPYRYPAAHKDELERQCAAMIEQGIVRRSDSPLSSPVLLVKKPDGSWRFCVDYLALNALTVKDAFPIPFFSKLDLQFGYHQVRMRPEDVHKTVLLTHDSLYEFLVMAFGLCNAPATFQALMNDVLRPFLRRFVLVFFDDILIYSKTWADHLRHPRAVLSELQRQQLFVKRAKCAFGASSVAYLGHVISTAGVDMDPAKVQAILDWPAPRSARAVRGFLGLAGYYRKFVHNYGTVTTPLTALLKKDGFTWDNAAAAAFAALKAAVTTAPVLAMPDFSKLFIVECDASSHGFSAVLEGHPVAFFSRPIAPRHRALAAYERELIGLEIRHWPPYLWGQRFVVKTDHYSLKYLFDQRMATIPQHHWVGKLLGFDFSIEYRSGAMNIMADALSRRNTDEGELLAISAPRFDFIACLCHTQATDPALVAIHDEVHAGMRAAPWVVLDDMVAYDGRLYIPPSSPLIQEILAVVHDDGHEGVHRTLHRLRRDFHFPNMRRLVQDFVRACTTCQRYKSEHLHPAGLLQSLPIPSVVWADIGKDFVEALPRVHGKTVILSVVYRFSKYCHFIPLAHPYTSESVAHAFFTDIVRLHGIPQSIVSDRDPVFTSSFWRELMCLMGTKLHMSSAFHPRWTTRRKLLTASSSCTCAASQAIAPDSGFGGCRGLSTSTTQPTSRHYTRPRSGWSKAATRPPSAPTSPEMEDREAFLADVCCRLEQAQAVQKRHYDRLHQPVSYQVGDWAFLRLRQCAATSLPRSAMGKLKPRFVGPYRVAELINDIAVRLELPPGVCLHDVFHVGVLKKFIGTPPATPPDLPTVHHGAVLPEPLRVERARLACGVRQVLVHWRGEQAASATWEDLDDFRTRFPDFQLEDELDLEGGRDVMCGRTYARRRRARDVRRASERATRAREEP
ncbi:LOW QUALITY PROTEIN: hypothetical protein U9M48_023250, partial [Paspalum notatum var. saurae]